jgi:5-methylcytosine-specific restriction endonuclease McrA
MDWREDEEVRQNVLHLFGHRCTGIESTCGKYTTTVHEILPRSRGKIAYELQNRIPLCLECHSRVHEMGVSDEVILKLQERRKAFLITIGRPDAD